MTRLRRALEAAACVGLMLLVLVAVTRAGDICIVPSAVNQRSVTVDCDALNPTAHGHGYNGYSTNGPPCIELAGCLVSPAPYHYGWSISASDTDPFVNSGPLPQPVASLYLWLWCAQADGMAAAEFAIETTGSDLFHVATNPRNGVLNAGTADQLLLAVGGCPNMILAAELVYVVTEPVSVESESWSDVKAMYR